MVFAILNLLGTFVFKFIGFMIRSLYNLIVMLSDVNILENSNFDNLKNNMFGLIGLFMVFKLAFSVIQYITNPDKLTDKSAGAGQILKKVVIVLVLLGTVNTIFEKAFELQGMIFRDAVLERLVFGNSSSQGNKGETIDPGVAGTKIKTSDYLAYSILAPFVKFNTKADIWGEDVSEEALEDCDEFILATDATLTKDEICHSVCSDKIKEEDEDAYEAMCTGLEERDMYKALIDVAMLRIDKTAVIDIDGVFGFLIGVVCIVVLTIISVGVAIRSVKLSFLNLIAPLPIISYIDPKSGENGMFSKWSKETIKTFLELFIRLLSFYFAILIITKVLTATDGVSGYSGTVYTFTKHPLVIIFLIIGCFLFALQLPKLVENLFGSLGGFSRDAKSTGALAAGVAGITGGIVGGAFSNAIGTAKRIKDDNGGHLGFGGALRSTLAFGTGALGTGGRSVLGAVKGMKSSGGGLSGAKWSDISRNAIARTGAIRNARAISYTTAGGRVRSGYSAFPSVRRAYGRFADMAGIKDEFSAVGRKKVDIKALENSLRTEQNNLARANSDRMAALQQYNAAVHERQMLENNAQTVNKNMFDAIGGSYDENLQDFVFNVNGQTKRFQDMSRSDYEHVVNQAKSRYTSSLSPTLSQSQRDSLVSNFEAKWKSISANASTLAMEKQRVQDSINRVTEYNNKLAAARTEEANWRTQYDTQNAAYNTYQSNINDINKNLNRANKEVETINKAIKKS